MGLIKSIKQGLQFVSLNNMTFIIYCAIGVFNTLIHYCAFSFLINYISYQSVANFIGFVFGLVSSFVLNGKITFNKRLTTTVFFKHVCCNGALAFLFGLFGDVSNLEPSYTFLIYLAINPIVGFVIAKYIVFK